MSNAIQPLADVQSTDPVVTTGARNGLTSGSDPPAVETSSSPAPLWPNPSMRIDGALGLVVLEFRQYPGQATASIPTERQLADYRRSFARHADTATPAAADTVTPAGEQLSQSAAGGNVAGGNATGGNKDATPLPAATTVAQAGNDSASP